MPVSLLKYRQALGFAGIIGGWLLLSAVSNQKSIRLLYCTTERQEDVGEVVCKSMRCGYKYYFFVPFSDYWEKKDIGYDPKSWCIRLVLDEMNK